MKINYEKNIAKFNLSKLSLMYPSVCPYLLEYPLEYIDITDSSVILGEIINNEYGIGYMYSIIDNDILKITHEPNCECKDKYNIIKEIYVNDSNFKDHILINISDLPMQYLKYLDVLNKLEKNKKLSKSIVKEKRKIRDLFRIRKKNDR